MPDEDIDSDDDDELTPLLRPDTPIPPPADLDLYLFGKLSLDTNQDEDPLADVDTADLFADIDAAVDSNFTYYSEYDTEIIWLTSDDPTNQDEDHFADVDAADPFANIDAAVDSDSESDTDTEIIWLESDDSSDSDYYPPLDNYSPPLFEIDPATGECRDRACQDSQEIRP